MLSARHPEGEEVLLMLVRMSLHLLLAFLATFALAFAWQALTSGEGAGRTAASLATVLVSGD